MSRRYTETAWVMAHKGMEFALNILLLKLLTTVFRDDPAQYGEMNLALTATVLLAAPTLLPVNQAYLRAYHGAAHDGRLPGVTRYLLWWYVVAAALVMIVAWASAAPIARAVGVAPATVWAAGGLFVASRWRTLGLEVLEVRRARRAWTLENGGFLCLQVVAIAVLAASPGITAARALWVIAAVSVLFAMPGAWSLLRESRAGTAGDEAGEFTRLVWTYGIPAAALTLLQGVQGFADRYVLGALTDLETVGRYVAAYQVSGVPYMLLMSALYSLCVPVAFQRTHDAGDTRQLWAGDRVMLAGLAVYCGLGTVVLACYAIVGPDLLRMMTASEFAVPSAVLMILATGRFVQGLSFLLQAVFSVHQRVGTSMAWRALGAVITIPLCVVGVKRLGLVGAAIGSTVAIVLYAALLVFGPSGCFWLIRDARHGAMQQAATPLREPAGASEAAA